MRPAASRTGTGATPAPWYFGMVWCPIHGYYTPGTSPGCPGCAWMFRPFPVPVLPPSWPIAVTVAGGG